ncbi:MAG: hypothetical protein M1838_001185 [Thelocarpon superellum]|nr:MAG: hypothetical protein M1838_001185 [Thelocarpon superellum]
MDGSVAGPGSIPGSGAPPHDNGLLARFTSARARRQLGLVAGGATFLFCSTIITRRSLARRYKASIPAFYQPSNRPAGEVNGAMEALEALNIATINVVSLAMMVTGVALWAFDVASVADMRHRLHRTMGVEGDVRTDRDADEEMEEWLATVLSRKEDKERAKAKAKAKAKAAKANET